MSALLLLEIIAIGGVVGAAAMLGVGLKREFSQPPGQPQSVSTDPVAKSIDALSKFTASLKELDATTRPYMISTLFLMLALIAASVDRLAK